MVKFLLVGNLILFHFLAALFARQETPPQTKLFRFHLYAFYGASGFHEDYVITQDSLVVSYDNDHGQAGLQPVYAIKLSELQSNAFYRFLKTVKADTLKPLYERKRHYSDGVWMELDLDTDFTGSKKVMIAEPTGIEFLRLVKPEINNLIKKKQYRM